MKVIHIMDNLSVAGGVNTFVYDLCYAMKKQKKDVTLIGIINTKDKNNSSIKKLKLEGVNVICLEARNKIDALANYTLKLRRIIREIALDEFTICNLHLKLSVLMGGISTIGLKNIKCIETYHSQYHNYKLEYTIMKRRISHYIPCSKSAGKEMKARFNVPNKKMTVIENGIVREANIIDHTNKSESVTLLSVGRLTKQKNYPVMIEAMRLLDSNDVNYNIIGVGEDCDYLRKKASIPNINFLGKMEREMVLKYTAMADMVCMPSLWEGLSIYMIEAFSLGKPMLLSDIPSFCDVVEEKKLDKELYRKCKWGYLVKVNNPKAYKLAITDFINHREDWKNMSDESYKISEKFDINLTAKKYIDVYKKMMK